MGEIPENSWHTYTLEKLFQSVNSSEKGLTSEEAVRRIKEFGRNLFKEKKKSSAWVLFLLQFKDVMILTLIAAAVVSGVVGNLKDTIVILIIILLNAVVGFVQEYKAEKAMEALKKLAVTNTKLIRDGVVKQLPAEELVPGDIVLLESGELVPADVRMIEIHSLKVDESSLTGEAYSVEKNTRILAADNTPIGDRYNMGFKGTVVSYGRGKAVVVATGMNTALGGIARMLQEEESVTPLQKRLAQFSKRLSLVVLAICVIIFASGYFRGEEPLKMLLTSISVAVAAIPEALPAVITIALAMGAKRLVKKHVLIRKLHAVETLGSVTYVCTDKTGTLTQNKMQVTEVVLVNDGQLPQNLPFNNQDLLLLAISLNQNTDEGTGGAISGDSTEVALLTYALEQPHFDSTWADRFERINEIPFDSDRKLMSTLHDFENGEALVITKGAIESLSEICVNREVVDKAKLKSEILSAKGQRVLAYAYKIVKLEQAKSLDSIESGLFFLGITGMIDPPRPEAKKAVSDCFNAGIKIVMITGDHPLTAKAIATELGILTSSKDLTITGSKLAELSDDAFQKIVHDTKVYARVSPDQKLRIVKTLQAANEYVAMTGDGVNDAPALKRANIGIAMGITGTDVSKESAHMILLDDNFATIVNAVKEGRRIFDNIRRFIKYILTCNAAEIWTIFLAPLIGLPIPLLPLQILWINLVTDGLPGLALAYEKPERDIMIRAPRHPKESIFANGLGYHVLWVGLLMGGISLSVLAWAVKVGNEHWQTMVFCTLCFSQMVHVMVIRSDKYSLIQQGLTTNRPLLGAVLLTFASQFAIVYIPAMQDIFSTQSLTAKELLICFISANGIFFAVEIEKFVKRRNDKNHSTNKSYE